MLYRRNAYLEAIMEPITVVFSFGLLILWIATRDRDDWDDWDE